MQKNNTKLRTLIKKGFLDSLYICKQEFLNILRDPGVRVFFVLATLAYPILYGYVYKNESMRDLPVAVVDQSSSSTSRLYVRLIDATPDVKVAYRCQNMEEAKDLYLNREVYGVLVVSPDFSQRINTGQQGVVSVYADMSSFMNYKAIMAATSYVMRDMGAGIQIKRLEAQGLDRQQARVAAAPFVVKEQSLFNTGGGYASFLLPAVLILIIQQTLLMGIGMLAGTAREKNKWADLIPISNRYHGTFRIVFGKGLCYFGWYMIVAFYILYLVPRFFNLPHFVGAGTLLLFLVPFLCAAIFFAMSLSVFMRNRENAMLIFLFLSVPLLMLSGVSWPSESIPSAWRIVGWFFPSTHGIQGFIRLSTFQGDLKDVSKEYFFLWIQTGIYFLSTCLLYRSLLLKSNPHNCKQDELCVKNKEK